MTVARPSTSSTPSGASAPSLPVGLQYQYNSANQRIRRTDSDSSYWVYQYDALGLVTSGRKYWLDGTPVAGQQFDYVFDDIGNRDTTGGRASAVSDYTANRLNQYTQRTTPNPATIDVLGIANPTANVTVNGNTANRKGEYFHWPLTVANGTAQYPTVSMVSQYGGDPDSGEVFVPPATESYTHDTDGNLTQDGRWDYVWEGENRLVKLRSRTGSPAPERRIEFEYDWQGRRIRQTVWNDRDDGQGSEVGDTIFLYDGWNVMGELNANAGNAKLRTYAWGLDLSGTMQGAGGVGGLLKVTDHSSPVTHHFVCYDGNGNVAALADGTSGALTARYEYGPFGEAIRTTGPGTTPMAKKNPFRFSTKYTDDQSGLLYYGYRYYAPSTGRWLSRDPIDERGGNNLYTFIHNSSPNSSDATGLCPCKCKNVKGGPPSDRIIHGSYQPGLTQPSLTIPVPWTIDVEGDATKCHCRYIDNGYISAVLYLDDGRTIENFQPFFGSVTEPWPCEDYTDRPGAYFPEGMDFTYALRFNLSVTFECWDEDWSRRISDTVDVNGLFMGIYPQPWPYPLPHP